MVKEVKYYLRAASQGAVFFYADMSVAIQTLVPAGCCYRCCMADSRALRVNRNTLGARKSSLY